MLNRAWCSRATSQNRTQSKLRRTSRFAEEAIPKLAKSISPDSRSPLMYAVDMPVVDVEIPETRIASLTCTSYLAPQPKVLRGENSRKSVPETTWKVFTLTHTAFIYIIISTKPCDTCSTKPVMLEKKALLKDSIKGTAIESSKTSGFLKTSSLRLQRFQILYSYCTKRIIYATLYSQTAISRNSHTDPCRGLPLAIASVTLTIYCASCTFSDRYV